MYCKLSNLVSTGEHEEYYACAAVQRNWLCADMGHEQLFYAHTECLSHSGVYLLYNVCGALALEEVNKQLSAFSPVHGPCRFGYPTNPFQPAANSSTGPTHPGLWLPFSLQPLWAVVSPSVSAFLLTQGSNIPMSRSASNSFISGHCPTLLPATVTWCRT